MALPKKRGKADGEDKAQENYRIDARVHVGHVHRKVAGLERALGFYCGVLGFEVMQRFGESAAFLSAGGYHHHLAVNTWESLGGSPPAAGTTGLYHTAIVYPTRAALGEALRRVIAAGIALDGAADHGVSESIYLRDPDENGVELYCDRAKELWPRTSDGKLAIHAPTRFAQTAERAPSGHARGAERFLEQGPGLRAARWCPASYPPRQHAPRVRSNGSIEDGDNAAR